MDEQQLLSLKPELDRFLARYVPLFGREENGHHAQRFVGGLLYGGERRNAENVAEAMQGGPVRSLQAFITTGVWEDRQLLAQLRSDVLEVLADDEAIVNLDETGFAKKGKKSVGVARQYSGTLGRVDNCQIAVFANYCTPAGGGQVPGHTLIDRRLYLPKEWTDDPQRCVEAGVPEEVVFRTKPELALEMVCSLVGEGTPFRWVGGDSVYGDNSSLVEGLRQLNKWYVLDVSSSLTVWTSEPEVIAPEDHSHKGRGRRRSKPQVIGEKQTVAEVVAHLPAQAWKRMSLGEGSQGKRMCECAEVDVWFPEAGLPGPKERLVVRRSLCQEPEIKVQRSNAPQTIALSKVAAAGAARWSIEEDFQCGKGECGLDEYETRGWSGWHHHTALAMLAQAFLTLQRQRLGEKRTADDRARGAGAAEASARRAPMEPDRDPSLVPMATGT